MVGESLQRLLDGETAGQHVYLPPDPTQRALVPAADGIRQHPGLPPLDVIFPVFHGLNGEDGTIQGLLELANVPYVGSGVLGSALGLDKIYMKRAFAAVGLPVVDYVATTRRHFETDPLAFVGDVEARFGYPCFAKFANSGSSVGTSKAHNRDEPLRGLRLAAGFDRKLLDERGIDARGLEVSVVGNEEAETSVGGATGPGRGG